MKMPGNARIKEVENEYMSIFDAMDHSADFLEEDGLKRWRYIFSLDDGDVSLESNVDMGDMLEKGQGGLSIECVLPYDEKRLTCMSMNPAQAIEEMMVKCQEEMDKLKKWAKSLERIRDRLARIMLEDGVD